MTKVTKDEGAENSKHTGLLSRCREAVIQFLMSLNRLPFYPMFRNWYVKRQWNRKVLEAWQKGPREGVPPHVVKQVNLRKIARERDLRVLIETGTYYGDMIEALKHDFDEIYSIEVFDMLYQRAKRRFRGNNSIKLFLGDSGECLSDVIRLTDGKPVLFWLDGHCSGTGTGSGISETPIVKELECIFSMANPSSVIVIDDANSFTGNGAYPELSSFCNWILERRPNAQISVVDNAIRVM